MAERRIGDPTTRSSSARWRPGRRMPSRRSTTGTSTRVHAVARRLTERSAARRGGRAGDVPRALEPRRAVRSGARVAGDLAAYDRPQPDGRPAACRGPAPDRSSRSRSAADEDEPDAALDRLASSGIVIGGAAGGARARKRRPRRPTCAPRLRQRSRTMPDVERTVIVLAYREGLTQSEIAERLGVAARHGEDADAAGACPPASTRSRRATSRCIPARRRRDGWMMDHADALERIELAAVEPDGLDRLMAGDTPDAAAVAGHLAGCPACTAELARIRRTATDRARGDLRPRRTRAPRPDARLRPAAGVPRGVAATSPQAPAPVVGIVDAPPAAPVELAVARERRTMTRLRYAVVALAAALVIAIGSGVVIAGAPPRPRRSSPSGRTRSRSSRRRTARRSASTAQPDAQRVALRRRPRRRRRPSARCCSRPRRASSSSSRATSARGRRPGVRLLGRGRTASATRLGKMYWAGDLWTWAGTATGLADLPAGATFGVSLGPIGGGGDSTQVLAGSL